MTKVWRINKLMFPHRGKSPAFVSTLTFSLTVLEIAVANQPVCLPACLLGFISTEDRPWPRWQVRQVSRTIETLCLLYSNMTRISSARAKWLSPHEGLSRVYRSNAWMLLAWHARNPVGCLNKKSLSYILQKWLLISFLQAVLLI